MIEAFKRVDEYCFTFLNIRIFGIGLDFFVDCGDWFIYIYLGDKFLRFSGGGFIFGRLPKRKDS